MPQQAAAVADASTGAAERPDESANLDAAAPKKANVNLPAAEIKRRLRSRGEPIRLFGEDLEDIFNRLRRLVEG